MHFTRLRLNGFKSFVDPTDLVIAGGLTGVVGPNGCGKSNLLEALRWVMGESRPTAMRGGGMEDVIFAGTSTRSARNFAEVSLQIDNADRLAPAGFNDSDLIEVIRRITRDAGSAYKLNGKDVRARDVQMLFADASTGATSPALVRQGQISELINAKPRARRRILEDAAGIAGLYQRRHEAELRLNAAEQNLARVDDVLEQLAQQLAQLARQAKQAARYRAIAGDLRRAEGMLLFRRWQEADTGRAEAEAALTGHAREAGRAETAAREADRLRTETETALPALREEEAIAAAVLQRLSVQRDALVQEEERARQSIRALTGRIEQMSRDIEREAALNRDAGDTLERLEAEASELSAEHEGHDAALDEAAEAAHAAADVLRDREEAQSQMTEDLARLVARHQSAQRLREDAARTLQRNEDEAAKARATVSAAEANLSAARSAMEEAEARQDAAQDSAEEAEARLIAADEARAEIQSREAEARAQKSSAEGEAGALRAEVAALARLVERDTTESGQILDLLGVDKGYEKALGAALADDLRAPVVRDGTASGWLALPPYPAEPPLPEGAAPLSDHVAVPEALIRRIGQIGLVPDAGTGARLQPALGPGQRLVSPDGDLWRWDGLRASAADAPSAAALRLQQLNRLAELRRDLDEAEVRAETASEAHEALSRELQAATEADRAAREARREADRALAELGRALSRAEADREMAESRLETARMAVARHEDEATGARLRLSEADGQLASLGDLDAARARLDDVRTTVEAARMTMIARRAAHEELKRDGEARTKRLTQIARDAQTWRQRLDTAGTRVAELEDRKAASEEELDRAAALPEEIAEQREALAARIETAETRRATAAETLAAAESRAREADHAAREAERRAGELREARAAAQARAEAARDTVAQAAARIAEELETTPADLLEKLGDDPDRMPPAEAIEHEVTRLKRQREALGAVNLRAEEDARAVQEEHDTLVVEKSDLDEAIRTLRAGIAGLNREGRDRLLTAFEQVNANFALLFTNLFRGGEARLVLVESDDPLEAGLEIMCQPPGKKLSTLSLLSGGEQTLTALALIFGVFLANPAPICVLDEVDAPLDDANVTRMCDMLDEMTRRTDTRFLIITHHALTMSRMDRLFGVTMAEQGVSQLVSVDLKKAEALVA
ncbi:chromosome segregation protein SMC [Rhodovulum sp. MB263]|uniref:chromosome segregation protein SMC n=1 Tax=Rhodovulum sp. (strain MB263) TaxID=308754 RepID=UPI0009B7217E|nr:chromosome segregation protein SMC [Rhodovulum sp. MB263]ARC87356.1 chromosome segregation protein SMC [Rhodovulum sp. MB263]